jgi:carbonic anhydrase
MENVMSIDRYFRRNREWAAERTQHDPDYFRREAARHEPTSLFIGCSDARVPANVITGTEIGELFVHRNIANQVVATDNNLLAVVEFAIEVLRVGDIIICGQESCGGVRAALGAQAPAHVESWITQVRTVARLHATTLAGEEDAAAPARLLDELNVREQINNLRRLPAVQRAWGDGRRVRLHGWMYGLHDGLLRDLGATVDPRDARRASMRQVRRLRRQSAAKERRP